MTAIPVSWLMIPFALQGTAMLFDEFHFHRKRGLARWERVGHPLDTLSVLACFGFISAVPPTDSNIRIYVGLCAFSCLFITKDEGVHTGACDATENWLHAILFVLHPVTFFAAGMMWQSAPDAWSLTIQPYIVLAFLFYQVIYWNIWAPRGRRGES